MSSFQSCKEAWQQLDLHWVAVEWHYEALPNLEQCCLSWDPQKSWVFPTPFFATLMVVMGPEWWMTKSLGTMWLSMKMWNSLKMGWKIDDIKLLVHTDGGIQNIDRNMPSITKRFRSHQAGPTEWTSGLIESDRKGWEHTEHTDLPRKVRKQPHPSQKSTAILPAHEIPLPNNPPVVSSKTRLETFGGFDRDSVAPSSEPTKIKSFWTQKFSQHIVPRPATSTRPNLHGEDLAARLPSQQQRFAVLRMAQWNLGLGGTPLVKVSQSNFAISQSPLKTLEKHDFFSLICDGPQEFQWRMQCRISEHRTHCMLQVKVRPAVLKVGSSFCPWSTVWVPNIW